MATVRLETPGQEDWGVVVDLMFASSGIEAEVIARARPVEVFENVTAPVASRGHLIALKVLAGRKRDEVDALGLISWASPRELDHAREALELITERGYHRDRDLLRILETWVRDVDPS